ncbi:MAG: TetR/AcrR family transcriptional regulator [Anaerolineae bacterium]|nr:TetR/AcrR family transcriptional regulator [Anaerolineae bacterium]
MQILQAATVCFARQGYHRTTMDDIAHESGVSKGSLYWHFKSKKHLFLTIMDEWMQSITQVLQDVMQKDEMTWAEKLRWAAEAIAADIASQQEFISIAASFWAEMQRDDEVKERMLRIYQDMKKTLAQIIIAGIQAKEFRPVDPEATAAMIIGVFDGVTLQWTVMPDMIHWPDFGNKIANIFIHGLEARADHG